MSSTPEPKPTPAPFHLPAGNGVLRMKLTKTTKEGVVTHHELTFGVTVPEKKDPQ